MKVSFVIFATDPSRTRPSCKFITVYTKVQITTFQFEHSSVDFLTWKSRSHIKSTVMKSGAVSVRCVGCTFFYAKRECFVSADGSKSVCTFCYETTRSKHLKNFGSIKMNRDLFEFTDYLIYDNMRIAPTEVGGKLFDY
jgi:hypothetical protein